MLKIKDNIDLKELEKFGFTKGTYYYSKKIEYEYYQVIIQIILDTKHIYIKNDYFDGDYACFVPNDIYDLIQAGLVEKVED